ncbi:glycosyltransferase [Synoicihabitans lomoniglobus]|uniref:Glycosyltransferase n=1 Tax=Synoicihabitans lomoniglobus TaxID=2909285 RepID=A0AAF0CSZ3_9BACT|nr:glycosyltransferase [Opitutaceae bacterium LMO-M01]WED67421.1 glycosyltransferase [Opitutaceae bacterium LMO-M01]
MENKLRILVLTSSTGGGHDARAQAFAEWCFELYRHGVDVRIEQMLEKSSVVSRSGVNLYNWIQVHMPFLHTFFYTAVEALSYLNRSGVSIGRGYYREVLDEYQPHLVLSVHDCLNRGYFQYARERLGRENVRCATYCGEFSGGWGYSRNWIEPSVDLYVSRTATARDFAVKHGIPVEKTSVRGHLMRPKAVMDVIPAEKRSTYLRKQLGLKANRFTIFLATGTNGANNHMVLLEALKKHHRRVQVIAVCGRNKEIYNELVHWRSNHPKLPLYLDGFSDVVHELMQVSDVIVTRGGTTSCAKALHFGCPIVFNAFQGIMPQERLTWKFFRNGARSQKIEDADDFARLIDEWMEVPEAYQHYRDDFLDMRYPDDQTELISDLVGLAEEASGFTVKRYPFPRRNGDNGEPPVDLASGNGAAI